MCTRHIIAFVAFILICAGVKLALLAAPTAEAVSLSTESVGVGVYISQLHQNVSNLPVQNVHDISFVFPGTD